MRKNILDSVFETIRKIFASKEIRSKVLFSLAILVVYRILSATPVVGIKGEALKTLFAGSNFGEISAMNFTSILEEASVVAIGLAPYINASIILQLLSTVIPKLEELRKNGAEGRRIISMYTRYLTVPLAVLQSFVVYSALKNLTDAAGNPLVGELSKLQIMTLFTTLTAGSIFMMWLSELVSESALGGGSTYLIFLTIIASLPYAFIQGTQFSDFVEIGIMIAVYLLIIAIVVFISEAEKRIKVVYSRRVRTGAVYENYVPLKLTQSGVMPVIFATSLFYFPRMLSEFIMGKVDSGWWLEAATKVREWSVNPYVQNIGIFVLIVIFSFFYITIVFNTDEYAENLQKGGAFIPAVRPGKATSEFLRKETFKLTAVGAFFLGLLAIMPGILTSAGIISVTLFSGTGLLIVVGAVMEMKRQIESMLVVRSYDKYI